MACMVDTLTLVKDKDFGLKLESATPAVDQPVSGVDEEEVDKMFGFHFPTMARSPAAMLPSFISFTRNTALHERGQTKVIYSIYKQ